MKHNNIIPNAHFHKDWQRYVRVRLNQPAKKTARRAARTAKAKQIAPRPLDKLRPIVRGQTNKYNMKVRGGSGFTFDELKAAGIKRREAPTLGITIDHRRKNRSEEAFQQNVARLKQYRGKLIVFPRNPSSKRPKKGDSSKEEVKKAAQNLTDGVLAIKVTAPRIKARKISEQERNISVVSVLHKQQQEAKLWGRRAKRAHDKKEGKSKAAKKAEEAGGADDDKE